MHKSKPPPALLPLFVAPESVDSVLKRDGEGMATISRPFTFSTPLSSSRFPLRLRRPSLSFFNARLLTATLALQHSEHDVVVVGAGIVGLTIARQLLMHSDLSVAIVDASVPCSGATGAGQGYIWTVHKTPGSDTWELARRGKWLWEELADSVMRQGMDPLDVLGWKKTGSLLVGRTSDDVAMLKERVRLLSQAGLSAEYLSATSLLSEEPAVEVGKEGGAAFLPDDCQLDALRAVAFIEKGNKYFASQGRYNEFYNNPALGLVRSGRYGEVEAVQTSENILRSKKAVVIAAGAWSGPLMRSLVTEQSAVPDIPVKPRKGHLLVLENFNKIQLNHGLMEVGYIDHQNATLPHTPLTSGAVENEQNLSSVSMTATIDAMGNLVLGSSRQFTGFCREVDETIIKAIWNRVEEFFPSLRFLCLDFAQNKDIRIGHRPYMPDGKPIIGPIPGLPKVLLATGHEGNGLCLALSTAEMVCDMILGNPLKVDCSPFRYPR